MEHATKELKYYSIKLAFMVTQQRSLTEFSKGLAHEPKSVLPSTSCLLLLQISMGICDSDMIAVLLPLSIHVLTS